MKMVKSLLLGTMAGMIACSTAYASDLSATKSGPKFLTETIINQKHLMLRVMGGYREYIPMPVPRPTIQPAFDQQPTQLIRAEIVIFEPKFILAEGFEGIKREAWHISNETGLSPACFLKDEYRISLGAGVGVTADPFHGIDYDHGA